MAFAKTQTKTHSIDLRVVAFESCRYIKLEKHKLDQIAERKIRISLGRLLYSFLDVKLQHL